MPPRRRLNLVSAATLPASRLPVGTPQLASFPDSRSRSPPNLTNQSSSPGLETVFKFGSGSDEEDHSSQDTGNMSASTSAKDAPTKSIAQAKLERQRAKYEEAEAARTGAPLPDKRAQSSRLKNPKWKPFDYTGGEASSRERGEDGAPATEVRINTFRPQSRATSLTRSMSVLSHRTTETGMSEKDRQDSTTDDGFQLYQGRKNRKNAGQLDAYENKPEQRQTTVEATFDERSIYEVFGNALPGPEFIDQNAGYKSGQLQFLQHPNGDVSAHQWSADRYMWENIGAWSNVRKKLVGQLASDHLKGETASQTLQQHPLAYFRIIAKQREANVTGQPFGAKEIQAALPEPPCELAAAPTGLKEPVQEVNGTPSTQHESQRAASRYPRDFVPAIPSKPTMRTSLPPQSDQYVQHQMRSNVTTFNPNASGYGARREGPFYSTAHYNQVYGSSAHTQQYYGQTPQQQTYRPHYPMISPNQGLNNSFRFPTPRMPSAGVLQYGIDVGVRDLRPYLSQTQQPEHRAYESQHYDTLQQTRVYQPHTTIRQVADAAANVAPSEVSTEVVVPQPQHVSAFDLRTAARDQLWKLPETAKERSASQANIRTVLFDPFQSESATEEKTAQHPSGSDTGTATAFSRNVAEKKLQPPPAQTPSLSRFFPTGLVPPLPKPASPSGSTTTNNLLNSSPDPPAHKQSYVQSTPMITRTSASQATPQTLQAPFFPDELGSNLTTSNIPTVDNRTYDEKLQDWWKSGDTFSRQEEFHQSLQRASSDLSSTLSSPPTQSRYGAIGPPSSTQRKDISADAGIDMSRLLIPVLENLASYVHGPPEKRRDYFSQWSEPAEWMIDHSPTGNHSFYDKDWGTPPARVGRDPRYNNSRSWSGSQQAPRTSRLSQSSGGYGSPAAGQANGLDRRFAFAESGRY